MLGRAACFVADNMNSAGRRVAGLLPLALALGLAAGIAQATCTNANPTVCSGGVGATVSATGTIGTYTAATAPNYPAAITVDNTVLGTVTSVSISFSSFSAAVSQTASGTQGVALMLVSPNGRQFEFFRSVADGTQSINFSPFGIVDGGTPAPDSNSLTNNFTWGTTSGLMTIGPSAYDAIATAPTSYPTIGHPAHSAQTLGSSTFASVFGGETAAGTWKIYMADNIPGDSVSFGTWTLTLGVSASASSTVTALSSGANPSFTGITSVGLTATVTSSGSPVTTGTVAFKNGSTTIGSCSAVALNGSGQASCSTVFGAEGNQTITAAYSGTASFGSSSGTLNQFVKNKSTRPQAGQYCNTTGAITMSGTQTAQSIYPSVINVGTDTTGFTNNPTVENVSVVINGLTGGSEGTGTVQFLLVSPSGHALDFMSHAGATTGFGPVNLTFTDAHPSLPESASIPSGTYQATAYSAVDVFTPQPPTPAPQVPGTFFRAQPAGTNIFQTSFSGDATQGDWLLFAYDNGGSAAHASITGWCINITPNTGAGTTTTLVPGPTPATTGTSVTFAASVVKSGNVPVTTGTVTFTENGSAPAGNASNVVSVNPSGQANYSTSGLSEGDHTITATYHDNTNANSDSFTSVVERINNGSTSTVNGATVTYCNTGQILIPGATGLPNNIGPASPNPSNVFVSKLFGTIHTASVQLKGFKLLNLQEDQLDSLLVGPGASTANSLDFFSGGNAGQGLGVTSGDYTFIDTGAAVPASGGLVASTSYKPTSYTSTQVYTSSISGFYTLPSPVQFSTPAGGGSSKTFAIFNNENPNNTWSLYFNSTVHSDNSLGDGAVNGWCVSLLENPPVLTATKGPSGLHVVQGQTGQAVTVVVHNAAGPGSAGGVSPVVVTDTFAAGLTPTGCSGTNWVQDSLTGQTIACHSTEFIAPPNDFDTLTINFSVGNTATVGPVNNTAVITGSGQAVAGVNSNTLVITIDPAPVLGVTKAPVGTFTQGATGEWDVTVNNTKAGSSTLGTTTVVDTLPTGYTLNSFNSVGSVWTCGSVTVTVTCTATSAVAGGSSFPVLQLFVNIPAASPISVTNSVVTFGGGDLGHTTSGNGAPGSSAVTVVQVPATVSISAGNNQTVLINTQFPIAFAATVRDAGSVVISGAPVTFTAPASGASGTFANTTITTTVNTNGSGVATVTAFTANSTAGGPYNVSVTAGSITNNFSATNIQPVIVSVTPNSGQQGATIASVALVGQNTHFVQGTSVANFGTLVTVNSLTVTDSTHASANITIQAAAATGARNVTVTTGGESASLANGFTVTAGTPVLQSATPNSGQQGATIASVALVGQFTHFVQGTSTVDFGAGITVNSLTVTDATHASANITIQPGAGTGTRNVVVTTGGEVVTLTNGFTVTAGTPVLLSVTPNSGAQGATISSVALVGQFTHFVQGTSVVSFGLGITINSLTVTDATHASANITIQPAATTGNRDVTVTTGGEAATLTNGFAVGAGTPVLQSATPNSGQQGATIASVALVGQFTHFVQGTSTVDFGAGITVNSLTVADATHASANITIQPAAGTGARNVVVTTGGEVVTLTNGFTVTAGTPVLQSATPNSGQQGATIASVALVGQFTHFVQGTSTVDFGAGITVNSLTVTDATHASANITIQPAAGTGARNVTVNTGGEVVTLTNGFTVTAGTSCTPPLDVTSALTAVASGFRVNLPNGHYLQTITLTNNTGGDISNVLYVLDSLTNATLTSPAGVTTCAVPAGSPYLSVGTITNGSTVAVKVDFTKQPGTITYTMRLLGGAGNP